MHIFTNKSEGLALYLLTLSSYKIGHSSVLRSSHKRCSRKNLIEFTGKHLCQSLFFNKVAGLRPEACNLIKKETLAQVFSFEFCEISKSTFFTELLRTTAPKCFHRTNYIHDMT